MPVDMGAGSCRLDGTGQNSRIPVVAGRPKTSALAASSFGYEAGLVALLSVALAVCSFGVVAARSSAAAINPGTSIGEKEKRGKGVYRPGQVIVKFDPKASDATEGRAHDRAGAADVSSNEALDVDLVTLASNRSVEEAVESYQKSKGVIYAEPNYVYRADVLPNDAYFHSGSNSDTPDTWGLHNTGQEGGVSDADIDAPEAWDILGLKPDVAWSGFKTTVGVVDSGIDVTHPELSAAAGVLRACARSTEGTGKLATGCNDDNGHGTHTAGTIAARGNDKYGIAGVLPGGGIFACKALGALGEGYATDVAACIMDMIARRDQLNLAVISLSLGGPQSKSLEAAVKAADLADIVVVASAGNLGNTTTLYPAGYPGVISVGATDRTDARASFSNYNDKVELTAPGVNILSTVPANKTGAGLPTGFDLLSGTSMAAPHVAGSAALVAEATGLRGSKVRERLDNTADDLGPAGRDAEYGNGRVNACRALGGPCEYRASGSNGLVASFNVGGEALIGEKLTLDASASSSVDGEITDYIWEVGRDAESDGDSSRISATYKSAGVRTVRLTVVDASGATATTTKQIDIATASSQLGILRKAKIKLDGGSKQGLAKSLRKGLKVRCVAPSAVVCKGGVTLAKTVALKAGFSSRHKVQIARGASVRGGPAGGKLTLRFTSKAKRKLAKVRDVSVRLSVEVSRGGATRTISSRIRLAR